MRQLAGCDNVVVKLSGFGPYAPGPYAPGWNAAGIRSIVHETIDLFGTERCMFASNYPVDRPFCGFTAMWRAYWQIAQEFGEDSAMNLVHDKAIKFYHL
jgi:predicted TIM-barrel fold metal-dependent hydrolase